MTFTQRLLVTVLVLSGVVLLGLYFYKPHARDSKAAGEAALLVATKKDRAGDTNLGAVSSVDTQGADFTNVVVVVAELTFHFEGEDSAGGLFRIVECLRGMVPTNEIRVFYLTGTGTYSPTGVSLLVLTRKTSDSPYAFDLIGGSVAHGILPNTPEMRARVLKASPDELAPVPWAQRLDESKAIALAKEELMARDGDSREWDWKCVGKGYSGWFVLTVPHKGVNLGRPMLFHVTDNGKVRNIPH